MRPRYLEIEGLHSFIEKQVIDFDSVSETGLFGIFGPTGSGKSTVLDAITLALFGEVNRALRGTYGIINTGATSVKVLFKFDLLKFGTRKTYKVFRIYNKKKGFNNSSEAKIIRLVEVITDMEVPIADKLNDVNEKIVELIGLKPEDFMRSVVLPQNKFQEFLFLEKSKKREMLERIFYLEEYGKELNDKTSKKQARLKNKIAHIEGSISQLGDASKQAFIQGERKLEEDQNKKNNVFEELREAEKHFFEAKEIWEHLHELEVIKDLENKHLSMKPDSEIQKVRLENFKKAQDLFDAVKKYEEIQKLHLVTLDSLKDYENKLPACVEQTRILKENIDTWQKNINNEKPILIEKKAKLIESISIQKEIDLLLEKIEELRKRYDKIKVCIKNDNSSIEGKKADLHKSENEITEKQLIIDRCRVSIDYRSKIQSGISLENEFNSLKDSLEKHELQYKELQNKIGLLEKNIEDLIQKKEELQIKYDALNKGYTDLEKILQLKRLELSENINNYHQINLNVLSLRNKREETLLNNMAVTLSKSLKYEEPCPVCGSKDHPKIANQTVNHHLLLENEIEEAQKQTQKLFDNNKLLEKEIDVIQKDLDIRNTKCLKLNVVLTDFCLQNNSKKSELMTNIENLQVLNESLSCVKVQHKTIFAEYDKFIKKHGIKNIKKELANLEEKDRLYESIQKEIDQIETNIKNIYQEIEKINVNKQKRLDEYTEIITEKRSIEAVIDEKRAKITNILFEGEMQDRSIEEIDKRLNFLEKEYIALTEDLKQEEVELNNRLIKIRTLETQRDIYSESLKNEGYRLNDSLKAKGFTCIEEIENAFLSKEAWTEIEIHLKKFEDTEINLRAQKNLRIERLKGRSLIFEEYTNISNLYESKKIEKDICISNFESSKNSYERIKSNILIWETLNSDFKKLTKTSNMLEQIQKLLKGNSFVEFIAEERLRYIAKVASETLGILTKYRYAIVLDNENGFIIQDNANGGVYRLITTLSGGEVFLTSLSLALALSKQIQLKGQSPLEFFFLDEGFGTLDNDLLDTVFDALERLSTKERVVGLISHVPQLRDRMTRKLIVDAPTPDGKGSRVRIEKA